MKEKNIPDTKKVDVELENIKFESEKLELDAEFKENSSQKEAQTNFLNNEEPVDRESYFNDEINDISDDTQTGENETIESLDDDSFDQNPASSEKNDNDFEDVSDDENNPMLERENTNSNNKEDESSENKNNDGDNTDETKNNKENEQEKTKDEDSSEKKNDDDSDSNKSKDENSSDKKNDDGSDSNKSKDENSSEKKNNNDSDLNKSKDESKQSDSKNSFKQDNEQKKPDGNKPKEGNNKPSNKNEVAQHNDQSKSQPQSASDNKRQEAKNKQENINKDRKKSGFKDNNSSTTKYNGNKNTGNKNVPRKSQIGKKQESLTQLGNTFKTGVKKGAESVVKSSKWLITTISSMGSIGFIIMIVTIVVLASFLTIFSIVSYADDTQDYSGYSQTDQKIIGKLDELYSRYPNVSAELATTAVIYPFFDEVWSLDVMKCVKSPSDNTAISSDDDEVEEGDDTEDLNVDSVRDDEYLQYFAKWKYRNRLKKFLKKLNELGEQGFYEYLKTDIFEKNGYGYDDMIDDCLCEKESLKNFVLEDLKRFKNNFSTTSFASLNRDADRNKIITFADSYVGDPSTGENKIPYYEGGLANNAMYNGNNFNTDVAPDQDGRTKKGLGAVGFVNWVYWSVISENFGNTNSIDNIIEKSYEIELSDLKNGDIGYDEEKTIIGIYSNGNWIYENAATGYVVSDTGGGKFTRYIRLNYFQGEIYNYTVRTTKPTPDEWNTSNIPIFKWPSSDSLIGECVFYVKNRALEIIQELYNNGSINDVQYKTYKDRLWNYSGNADQFWYQNINGNPGTVWQGYSNNSRSAVITDVRAGAIMGVTSTSLQGKAFGHVVIIEYANPDENKIIISDASNGTRTDCTKHDFKCISFYSYTLTYEQFYAKYGSSFRGFLFFLYNN